MSISRVPKVVEKYYSLRELTFLVGFNEKWWRERAQSGEFTVKDAEGHVVAEVAELGGELRIPASAVNAYIARNPYRYDAGVKARNQAELRRRLAGQEENAG